MSYLFDLNNKINLENMKLVLRFVNNRGHDLFHLVLGELVRVLPHPGLLEDIDSRYNLDLYLSRLSTYSMNFLFVDDGNICDPRTILFYFVSFHVFKIMFIYLCLSYSQDPQDSELKTFVLDNPSSDF